LNFLTLKILEALDISRPIGALYLLKSITMLSSKISENSYS